MWSSIERKQQRQETILWSFAKLKFATREQLQQIHKLGSDRNALKILGQMKEWLHVQNHKGKNVYYLNKAGRELIGIEEELKWSLQVDHHLMRNDMYIYFKCPESWEVERPTAFRPEGLSNVEKQLVSDARFQWDGIWHFVEVDRTQSMVENRKKIEQYAELSPRIERQLNHTPVIVFYTATPVRKERLKSVCEELKVSCQIYTKEDIH